MRIFSPISWTTKIGMRIISPIVPNPNIIESRPRVKHTPCINGSMNEELKAPDATPPESNAIDEIWFGTKNDKTMQHNKTGK